MSCACYNPYKKSLLFINCLIKILFKDSRSYAVILKVHWPAGHGIMYKSRYNFHFRVRKRLGRLGVIIGVRVRSPCKNDQYYGLGILQGMELHS